MSETKILIPGSYPFYKAVASFILQNATNSIENYIIDEDDYEEKDENKRQTSKNYFQKYYEKIDYNQIKIDVNLYPDEGSYAIDFNGKQLKGTIDVDTSDAQAAAYATNSFYTRKITLEGELELIKAFIKEGIDVYLKKYRNDKKINIYKFGAAADYMAPTGPGMKWQVKETVDKVESSIVYLPEAKKESLINDIEEFRNENTVNWFRCNNVGYRRCYLFHGIPKSGKFTLTKMLASYFGMDIYEFDNYPRRGSSTALKYVPNNSILLVQDVEDFLESNNNFGPSKIRPVYKSNKKMNHNMGSEQLIIPGQNDDFNFMDKFDEYNSGIIIFTTTDKELLDELMFDYSFIDCEVEFKHIESEQVAKMVQSFYPELKDRMDLVSSFSKQIESLEVSPATLRRFFVKYKDFTDESLLEFIFKSIKQIVDTNKELEEQKKKMEEASLNKMSMPGLPNSDITRVTYTQGNFPKANSGTGGYGGYGWA